jgi:Domain of unknown function (DUF4397)
VKTRIFLCLLLSLALLQGCSKSGGGSGTSNGSVRLVNASLANASLDMTVSSSALATTTFASGITTGNASAVVAIAPGTYTFSLVAGGNPVSQQSLLISSAMPYALVAHPQGGQLQLTALTENELAPAAGDGKIRVSNLALQDSGGVDVYMAASGGTPTSVPAGVSPIVSNLGVASGYFEVPQGTYQVWVTGVGKPADVRLYLPAVVITNPQVTTLVLTSTAGGILVDGWLVTQGVSTVTELPNTSARIRVAANIAGSGTVVATVNGVQLDGSTLVSPQLDSYAVVPSGALTVSVVVGGTTFAPTLPAAAAGADYTLLVAGTAASPTFNLISDNNTLPPGGMAKLRLVNGVNVTGAAVNLSLTADVNQVAQNVAFGTASTPATLAPGINPSSLQVTPALSSNASPPVALTWSPSSSLTLQSQGIYSVFVLGGTTAPDVPTAIVRADR